ncbi:MAG: nucleotidyl transferase AbiEii/AbiGii toxin family protein [Verrucomicrobia bacterium]|nr:nucleotidyl transferase AbiEii/AbiGii toxin family protein [Verrucomicrobiota bacterium]
MIPFEPQLHILPASQRRLWPELRSVPAHFVLYGGTAIGLWLGHRTSVDFDFFSSESFTSQELLATIPFLADGVPLQSQVNTLTLLLRRDDDVKVSFFGGLTIGRVGKPERIADIGLAIASQLDLAATKARVVVERAERKDYLDIAALLESGMSLAGALGAARALYGDRFNPIITLKALTYFADGDLPKLPDPVKEFLSHEASRVRDIPQINRLSDWIRP